MFLQRAAPSLVRPSRTLLSQQAAWSEVQYNGRRHCGPPISACACMRVPEDWPTRSPRGRAAAPADIAQVLRCAASRPPAREPGPARPRAAAAAPSPAVSACRYQSAPHTAACHGCIMSVRAKRRRRSASTLQLQLHSRKSWADKPATTSRQASAARGRRRAGFHVSPLG